MKISKDLLVSISGVRGITPTILSNEVCYSFISAFCKVIDSGPIVLSSDTRASGKLLKKVVISALGQNQRKILDAGIVSLPSTAIATKKLNASGAICITASHNPIEFNGLKFLNEYGEYISKKQLESIVSIVEKSGDNLSEISFAIDDIHQRTVNYHTQILREIARSGKRLIVAVDAVNGAGSEIIVKLLRDLNCDVIEIATNPNESFPRKPEPTPSNLEWTQDQLKGRKFDVAFVVDPDADRLSIIDENNTLLSEELTLPLVLLEKLNSVNAMQEGTIVLNMSTSRIIEDMVKDKNIKVIRSTVGEKNVVEKMKSENAFFGGEGNGGVIDPSIHYNRDSLVGIVNILNLLRRENRPLSEIVRMLPNYYIQKESINLNDRQAVSDIILKIKKQFAGENINLEDGIRIDWDDRWVHIRPSSTEPILRIIAEARTQETAIKLIAEIKKYL